MRHMSVSLAALLGATFAVVAMGFPMGAGAQVLNGQRDCKTLLTCNYSKTGSFRGCLSSYSCRSCRFVPATCTGTRPGETSCSRLRCSWGA